MIDEALEAMRGLHRAGAVNKQTLRDFETQCLPPRVCEAMLERLNADLRQSIREGFDSGPAIAADQLFAELNARYAEPSGKPATKPRGKRKA
jgi:hypothetical protein